MPKIHRSKHGRRKRSSGSTVDGVEVAGAIEACDLRLGVEILHRETKGIKLDRDMIISGEATKKKLNF